MNLTPTAATCMSTFSYPPFFSNYTIGIDRLGPELGQEVAQGEEAGPGSGLGHLGGHPLEVEHEGLADLPAEPLDGLHVHRLAPGILHVEHVHGLLPHRGHVGAGHRQPVLPEHPRHVRQQTHPVLPAQLHCEALHND
jgi:hypothetical protein